MSEHTDILALDAAIDAASQRHEAGEPGDSLLDVLASLNDLEWPERDLGERIAAGLTSEAPVVPLKRRRPIEDRPGCRSRRLRCFPHPRPGRLLGVPVVDPSPKATSVPAAGKWELAGYYEPPGFRQTGLGGPAGPMTCPSATTCYLVNAEYTPNQTTTCSPCSLFGVP